MSEPGNYDGAMEFICGDCLRRLPYVTRVRFKRLRKRFRKAKNRGQDDQLTVLRAAINANWRWVRSHFEAPDKPLGLDAFFDETGL